MSQLCALDLLENQSDQNVTVSEPRIILKNWCGAEILPFASSIYGDLRKRVGDQDSSPLALDDAVRARFNPLAYNSGELSVVRFNTNRMSWIWLLLTVSPWPALAARVDVTQHEIAHLFPEAEHAAAGTCFPRFHLELWNPAVIERKKWAERSSPPPTQAASPCPLTTKTWSLLHNYFRAGTDGHDDKPGWQRPRLAVTLEGGGSKSAPFAMGALAGLQRLDLLNSVDIVSSVSGGSYAAYFYFSRLLDAAKLDTTNKPDPRTWFEDCVPSIYANHFNTAPTHQPTFCNPGKTFDDIQKYAEKYPYQAHVRFYQDLIYPKGGMRLVNEKWVDKATTYANVGWQSLLHVATVPLHTVMNTLLAMPENTSPSRFAYRAGIERAYGHTLHTWMGASHGQPEPTSGELVDRVNARNATLFDLAALTGKDACSGGVAACRVPLWIANAASSSGRDLTNWLTVPANDALRASFEMSPFGQGSGTYGFIKRPVTMRLADVVGASAAFLDRDQRDVGTGARRILLGVGISALNLEWGSDIHNYNVSDTRFAAAHVTPFPLYHVDRQQERFAPTIHLSDGGNTDNLGALAAIRHGAENIIVVASTGDGAGNMRSLCRAKNHLELDGVYRVQVPQLRRLDWVCNAHIGEQELVVWGREAINRLVCKTRKDPQLCVAKNETNIDKTIWAPDKDVKRGYDMWAWTPPVLQGRVERDWSEDAGDPGALNNDKQPITVSRLFVIKPAFDNELARKQLADESGAAPARLCGHPRESPRFRINRCTASDKDVTLPCEALAFAMRDRCSEDKAHGAFPQHGVEITTLNSSYALFGAYFDLGRHSTMQLRDLIAPSDAGVTDAMKMRVYSLKTRALLPDRPLCPVQRGGVKTLDLCEVPR